MIQPQSDLSNVYSDLCVITLVTSRAELCVVSKFIIKLKYTSDIPLLSHPMPSFQWIFRLEKVLHKITSLHTASVTNLKIPRFTTNVLYICSNADTLCYHKELFFPI